MYAASWRLLSEERCSQQPLFARRNLCSPKAWRATLRRAHLGSKNLNEKVTSPFGPARWSPKIVLRNLETLECSIPLYGVKNLQLETKGLTHNRKLL
jgi:hypothetical protein